MSVNFEWYKTFYFVAKEKSITGAARVLYVTQPTVTHLIQSLEEELGCQLFIRSKRGVALTTEGELLYQHIEAVYSEIAAAESDLARLKDFQTGEVSIGASETTFHYFLFDYLKKYKTAYPQIHLKISNFNTFELMELIRGKKLDFGVMVCPQGYKDDELHIEPLVTFRDMLIAAGSEYQILSGRAVSLEELGAYPLITIERHNLTYHMLQNFYEENQQVLQPDIEFSTTDLIVPAVLNGLGVAYIPEFYAKEELKAGSIFEIQLKKKPPLRDICLVYRKDKSPSLAVRKFIELF